MSKQTKSKSNSKDIDTEVIRSLVEMNLGVVMDGDVPRDEGIAPAEPPTQSSSSCEAEQQAKEDARAGGDAGAGDAGAGDTGAGDAGEVAEDDDDEEVLYSGYDDTDIIAKYPDTKKGLMRYMLDHCQVDKVRDLSDTWGTEEFPKMFARQMIAKRSLMPKTVFIMSKDTRTWVFWTGDANSNGLPTAPAYLVRTDQWKTSHKLLRKWLAGLAELCQYCDEPLDGKTVKELRCDCGVTICKECAKAKEGIQTCPECSSKFSRTGNCFNYYGLNAQERQ